MLDRLFSRFRKHSFDLDNPTTVKTGMSIIEGREITYTKFHCTSCGKTLSLGKWQMITLPISMSHGCNPSINQPERKISYVWKTDNEFPPCLTNADGTCSIPAHIFWGLIVSVLLIALPVILIAGAGIKACITYIVILFVLVGLLCIS